MNTIKQKALELRAAVKADGRRASAMDRRWLANALVLALDRLEESGDPMPASPAGHVQSSGAVDPSLRVE